MTGDLFHLSEGVCDEGQVTMSDGKTFEVERSLMGTPIDLGVQSVIKDGQSLVFAETRTRSKSLATKAADAIFQILEKKEITQLEKISKKLLSENEHTELVKTLALLSKKRSCISSCRIKSKMQRNNRDRIS